MAVTYRLPQAGGALQNPAYRLADALQMRGSAQHAGPLANFEAGTIELLSLVTTLVVTIHYELFRPQRTGRADGTPNCAAA